MGALALAQHGAATGGSGAIILYFYRRRGWNAGQTQMLVEGSMLLLSLVGTSSDRFSWSLFSLIATAGVLFVWHRPGRYAGY